MATPPFTRPADFLRERDFGRKIEASIDFVRAHFRPLGRCLLYIVLPLQLLQSIASGLLQARMGGFMNSWRASLARGGQSQAESMRRMTELFSGPEYWVVIASSLLAFTLLMLTVYGYLVLRLEKADPAEPVTVPEVWAVVRQRFLGALGSLFGLTFIVLGGVFAVGLLVVGLGAMAGSVLGSSPALIILSILGVYALLGYAAVVLSLFFIVQMRERTGFFATIGRCFRLVWGKWWSTFGLIMVMSMLLMTLVLVIYGLTSLISSPFAPAPLEEPTALARVLAVVAACLNSLGVLLLYPLLYLALAFQYFNLVERKEGHGLYALIDTLGTQPAAATPRAYQPDDEGEY